MSGNVIVSFGDNAELRFGVAATQDAHAAKGWLDEQFLAFDCEPLRASGKILLADKLLAIAEAAGPAGFADGAWAHQFAAATLAASGRPRIHIDVAGRVVSF
jgi:hypothetical protein